MSKFEEIVEETLNEKSKRLDTSVVNKLMKLLQKKKFEVDIDSDPIDSLAHKKLSEDMVDIYGYIDSIGNKKRIGIAISWVKDRKKYEANIDEIFPISEDENVDDLYKNIVEILDTENIKL